MLIPKYLLICLLTTRKINIISAQVIIARIEPHSQEVEEHEPPKADGHSKTNEFTTLDNNPETFTQDRTSTTTNEAMEEGPLQRLCLNPEPEFIASSIVPEETALENKPFTGTQRDAGAETSLEVKLETSAGLKEQNQITPSTAVEDGAQSLLNPKASVSSTQRSGNQPQSVLSTQRSGNQLQSVLSTMESGTQPQTVSSTQRFGNQLQSVSSTQRSGNQPLSVSSTQRSENQPLSISSTQRSGNQPPNVSATQTLADNSQSSSQINYESILQFLSQSQNGAAFSQIPSENILELQSAILNSFPRPRNDQKAKINSEKELGDTKVLNTTTPEASSTPETNYLEYFWEFLKKNNFTQQNNHSGWNHDNTTSQSDNDDENAQNVTADDGSVFNGSLERAHSENNTDNTEFIKVPFCCFDLKASKHCSQGDLAMPVAVDHCKQPRPTNVSITPTRNLNCSANNRLKISLNTDSKVIAFSEARALFSFNYRFIREFCIEADLEQASQWWAVVCAMDVDQEQESVCPGTKCLKKCCPVGQALLNSSCVCHVGKSLLSEIVLTSLANFSGEEHQVPQISRYGMPNCNQPTASYILDLNEKMDFDSQRRNIIKGEPSPSSELSCVDDSLDELESVTSLVRISCGETKAGIWKTLRNVLIPAGLIVSCVFLLGTLTCHLCVAPLRDLHGLCLAAYMGALLVGDASLFTIKMYSGVLSRSACLVMGTIVHVSFLSTFMWLNVVCVDIW
ncbi:serine-rich adhesin for platelets-like [Palaemon carinicauda]|uniref:serine-rich adhesin for platelets-like n=1 Tax=Palaemon carinicauda TaxID=392227 RepID=UPI0035B6473B